MKSPAATRLSSGPAGVAEGGAVAVEAALGAVDVEAAADGGDGGAAPLQQVGDGGAGAGVVVGVDGGQRLVLAAAAADDGGDLQLGEEVGQRVVGVDGDQEDAVDAVGGEVLGEAASFAGAVGEGEEELEVGRAEGGADAAEDVGEVRLGEEAGLGFGDDQGDGVGAVGGQGAGGGVRDVTQFRDGGLDGGAGGLADAGEPLMTRETVPRPTPARAATSSRVGRPPLRPLLRPAVIRCLPVVGTRPCRAPGSEETVTAR